MSHLKRRNIINGGLVLSIVTLMTIACSCGKKPAQSETPTDSVKLDTIPADTVAVEEDSLKVYYSDDLKSFGIRGDVVERAAMRHGAETVYPEPTMELTFDDNGVFTGSLQGLYPKKNEDGINYSYSMNYEDGTSWELIYTELNDNSYPVKAEILESGPQGVAKAVLTYSGYEYDGEGNWIMRAVSMTRDFTATDTEEKTSSTYKWKELVSYKYKEKKESEEKTNQDK
ncbi:MAG: hypothetical protein K2L89_03940 [Muribaculaceae bacterium]|nr:hypothetical protein [Muribaculaceae bacterium]